MFELIHLFKQCLKQDTAGKVTSLKQNKKSIWMNEVLASLDRKCSISTKISRIFYKNNNK